MTIRRNVISLLIWCVVVVIFVVHVILTRKKSEIRLMSHRSLEELKNIGKDNFHNIDINNGMSNMLTTNSLQKDSTRSLISNLQKHTKYLRNENKFSNNSMKDNGSTNNSIDTQTIIIKDLKNQLEMLEKENKDLNKNNKALVTKEKQLKNLARRLAAKLKGREGGLLPKLDPSLPWVFGVTPTFARYTQKADLIRLSQTLLHVVNLHWIIVEDSSYRTDLVSKLLIESGLSFTHLNAETPSYLKRKPGEKYNKHHRGVVQRNLALKWIRENVNLEKTPGVVYFMDDDNTYHRKLFDEMRWAHHLAVWPVALTGGLRFAGPKCENGKVIGFHTKWAPDRSFPIDMAGFSISLNLIIKEKPDVLFDSTAKRGFLEPNFLEKLTTMEQLEPMGSNCTKVLVWHTRTEIPRESLKGEKEMARLGKPSDPSIET